jgi:hypothetical protein
MDLQCGEQPLKLSFLELFIIACCKNMWVADHISDWEHSLKYLFYKTCA